MRAGHDRAFLHQQYQRDDKLKVRISLYSYGSNSVSWHQWVFSHLSLQSGRQVLEIGCGNGQLWKDRLQDVPPGVRLVLTDRSDGMLRAAERLLVRQGNIEYLVADAESVPLESQSMDLVIANHMLYHVEDLQLALREVRRVLKPKGVLVATTNGRGHLAEINSLLEGLGGDTPPFSAVPASFNGGNALDILRNHFGRVEQQDYTDILSVPSTDPILEYILSVYCGALYPDLSSRRDELSQVIGKAIAEQHGFRIHTHACLFSASDSHHLSLD